MEAGRQGTEGNKESKIIQKINLNGRTAAVTIKVK